MPEQVISCMAEALSRDECAYLRNNASAISSNLYHQSFPEPNNYKSPPSSSSSSFDAGTLHSSSINKTSSYYTPVSASNFYAGLNSTNLYTPVVPTSSHYTGVSNINNTGPYIPGGDVYSGGVVSAGMSMGIQGVYTTTGQSRDNNNGSGGTAPAPHLRSHSLDQLNFEEKRQLIASTLSLSEFLGAAHNNKLTNNEKSKDGGGGMDSTASTPIFAPSSTPLFTSTSPHGFVGKSTSLSLSDLLSATKSKTKKSKKGKFIEEFTKLSLNKDYREFF